MRTGLVVVAVALVALVWGAAAIPAFGAGHEAEVRIAAQRLGDGRTEFALQQRGKDGEWGERVLPTRRFFPAQPRLERWLNSSPLTVRAVGADEDSDGTEVRITAQRIADGRTEFALQVRGTDGQWGARVLPTRRFFPAQPRLERWLSSSPLKVAVPAPTVDGLPAEGTFQSISVGREHICGVRSGGTVACWGSDNSGQATPPGGSFKAVSAGSNHTCAIRADGSVSCWGAQSAPPPEGTFTSVSAGFNHTCGVKLDGAVACWGDNRHGQASAPEGSFTSVSGGHSHTCGLRTDGTLTCWGDDASDQLSSPEGAFKAVSAGLSQACAVKTDGMIECWGAQRHPPVRTFTNVSVGVNLSCAITATGAITCWGGPHSAAPSGTFEAVSAGFSNACAVKGDGSVTCWGETFGGQASPPGGAFDVISSGRSDTCGIRDDATLACWGSGYAHLLERTQPSGSFREVSAGEMHACAVRTDGSITCWGSDHQGQATPPESAFTSVSAGLFHSCGLRDDGAVACWGSDSHGQAMPPDGVFISLSSGSLHTCAVGAGGAVTCWGLGFDEGGFRESPAGAFGTISAGEFHTCGIRTDGTVACWGGSDTSGQSTPPSGAFMALGAGAHHTCGIRSDGTVACWGLNLDGQSTPPDGTFTLVSGGDYHTCGVRTDGTAECWGRGSRPTPAPTPTGTPKPPTTPGPTPTPPSPPGSPGPELPCEDCRADTGAVRVAHTDGDGVASRDDCRDDARTGQRGLPEGTRGERVATGTGRCASWSYVTAGSWAGWVRDRYLASVSPAAPLVPDPIWQPPLPMVFCTIPLQPELGAGFSATQFREAVREAVATWNTALQNASHDHPLTGPAIQHGGDCGSEESGLGNGRYEVFVQPLASAGRADTRQATSNGETSYEVDIAIAPWVPPGCELRSVIMHEMGHALGLDHGGDLGDLMYTHYLEGECVNSPNETEVAAVLDARAPRGPDSDDPIPTSGRILGDPDAPIRLVAFEDFQCHVCRRFTNSVLPRLEDEYIRPGLVSVEYRHLAGLGPISFLAAAATECAAEQDQFWSYHDLVFGSSPFWFVPFEKAMELAEELNSLSGDDGLDLAVFQSCLESGTTIQAVQDETEESIAMLTDLGATRLATPTFVLNGRLWRVGLPAIDTFRADFDRLLAAE